MRQDRLVHAKDESNDEQRERSPQFPATTQRASGDRPIDASFGGSEGRGVEGSTASDTTEETQAMPAPDFDEDPAAGPEPSEGSTGPDDQAPPLHTPDQGADGSDAEAPDRPTVAPAASQQNQATRHSDPSAQ